MKHTIAILLAVSFTLSGCSLFAPPQPSIKFYNIRITQRSVEKSPTPDGYEYTKIIPVDGDRVVIESEWPDDFIFKGTYTEQYNTLVLDREMLDNRTWTIDASGNSDSAAGYAANQTDKAKEVIVSTVEAAADVGTAGISGAVKKVNKQVERLLGGKDGNSEGSKE